MQFRLPHAERVAFDVRCGLFNERSTNALRAVLDDRNVTSVRIIYNEDSNIIK